jgi:hypothetical protein
MQAVWNGRLVTRQKFFRFKGSRLSFFNSSFTAACLYFRGKQPVANETLKKLVINGASKLANPLTSQVVCGQAEMFCWLHVYAD